MEYEGRICRSPMERSAFMLPIAVGCAYNACKFCDLFKDLTYRELPLEQVEAELARVRSLKGNPEKVFFGDGNAFGMDTDRLLTITDMVHKYFPACHTIKMDATITNIRRKSDEELRRLSDAGIKELYLGIESGLDDVLKFMHKDHGLQQAYEQIARLKAVNMDYAAHIMNGVAGRGRAIENAEATAEFLNRTQPRNICNFSMFVHTDGNLLEDLKSGRFRAATEYENLLEEKRLLECLEMECAEYDGFHDCIQFRVRGSLPKDKAKMIQSVEKAIKANENNKEKIAYTGQACWIEGFVPYEGDPLAV